MEEGFDAVNMDRVRLLLQGEPLPPLSAATVVVRRSSR